jgi:hypothetical protein
VTARQMTPEEYAGCVEAITRRRGEEGDRAAAALAAIIAYRIDRRVKELDAMLSELKA